MSRPSARQAAAAGLLALAVGATPAVAHLKQDDPGVFAARQIPTVAAPAPEPVPTAAPAPKHLPTIDYWDSPQGFEPDAATRSVEAVREGLHPKHRLPVYDAPGGVPRAFLNRTVSGLPATVPIVERRRGWTGVLLPSVNRRVGWLPPGGWETRKLHDQLVVDLSEHRLTWLRDGRERGTWTVAVGSRRTPTPLGRTFVMGRTITHGHVYAGLDALVLGAVPDDRDALSASLRNGHTAIHAWHEESAFGRSISNGCVRMPPDVQRTLLAHIKPGTVVQIVR
ncbi:L,D-transpeptidase [Paractinoplanes abujensis]|uniref:Lipoprotein-anchoring transpeptidase ErfK/SrfK n=1 Tax=Paractinoplanes abujensis TaxID=882441 RepID=A0A7W7CSY6_9ACTN|nr:L,D-transpeptidase [Actinoplanes abujensis]MBB4694112.1 lipoprotein-anchoring transpeptidase ErfK/SrfK [Actinoplanes abujensis]